MPPLVFFFATLTITWERMGRNGLSCVCFSQPCLQQEKEEGGAMPPLVFFFQNINYIKRKKGGTMPPLVYFFCNITCSKKGGANPRGAQWPLCVFFHNIGYIKRKRGEAMPPLGFVSKYWLQHEKEGGTVSPLHLFRNNSNNKTKKGI